MQKSIDCGLRVGLAVLTEAVLVAPLDGIGDVRILNNADGTEFLSIDFCGPIRAAGRYCSSAWCAYWRYGEERIRIKQIHPHNPRS